MTYIAASCFDQDTWRKQGVNWARKSKSAGLNGYVIGNLDEESQAKAKELGFPVLPLGEKEPVSVLAGYVTDRCLFTQPDFSATVLSCSKEIACTNSQSSVFEIVSPIAALKDRAKAARVIREFVEQVYGTLLSSRFILGTGEFWKAYAGFQSYLKEKKYLEFDHPDLLLNLYIALTNSFSLEVMDYHD